MSAVTREYEFHDFKRALTVKSIIAAIDAVRPKDFYFEGEMHDFWELVCVTDGTAAATGDERVYTLKRGDLIFHKPMEFHRVWSAEGTAPRLLIVSFKCEGDCMEYFNNRHFHLNDLMLEEFAETEGLLQRAIALYDRGGTEYTRAASLGAAALENFLLRLYGQKEATHREETRYAAIYGQTVSYLEDNLCRKLTVDEVARACGLSTGSLKRIFKMFCDKGIIEYHNFLRIRTAVKLLGNGKSIKEVSNELGFSSVAYFQVVFKRTVGSPPGGYMRGKA